ncbi:unnamed protein product [Hymenolepis diminuta]|uniref:ubiquitinyl hydrolase 1 n=2 Tax=Hymenolepis diminuta TaxID=6216 RepID=A0A0R3S8Q4_HYMDI|nr:unnamed protein product [Hymenolepis diminuta]
MDVIYHEKQLDRCCAQHCLNSLLQGPYFTVESLAEIANNLDECERATLTDQRIESVNCDESGDFSIQVITVALQNLGLELVPYMRRTLEAEAVRANPAGQQAYICHFDMHWLAIRRLGNQWFDLNSLHSHPRLLTPTYLAMYLTQLSNDGYSIWYVTGTLPECEADQYLRISPLPEPCLTNQTATTTRATSNPEQDPELQEALKLSLQIDEQDASLQSILAQTRREAEERDLMEALRLSVQESRPGTSGGILQTDEEADIQEALRLSLSKNA